MTPVTVPGGQHVHTPLIQLEVAKMTEKIEPGPSHEGAGGEGSRRSGDTISSSQ